jgi:hypothetical protein
MRRDFPDTALWLPAVVTGADGRAVISLKLPDTLTRWRIVVKAVTAESQIRVGEGSAPVTVTQAVTRPLAPRVLAEHDTVEPSRPRTGRAVAFTVDEPTPAGRQSDRADVQARTGASVGG